jgi:formate dehydrogenase (coenzyme F420) beta subunit
MSKVEESIKNTVKDLFKQKKIDILLGYRNGSLPLTARPCFIREADGVDDIVWNSFCANNLAAYLPEIFQESRDAKTSLPRVGVIVKSCDARSVAGLIKENQVPKENIVLIGVPCRGIVDTGKVKKMAGSKAIDSCIEKGDSELEVRSSGGDVIKVNLEDVLSASCLLCQFPKSDMVDISIEGKSRAADANTYKIVKGFASKTPEERWQYLEKEISKCIKCYACRQACPNCYCKVCFADQEKPRWAGVTDKLSDLMMFHIGRIFHQAGRCVECGACTRACPMDINLGIFLKKLGMDVKELFQYSPGISKEKPPLSTYKDDDDQGFITEPEGE